MIHPPCVLLTAQSCSAPPGWREDSSRNGSRFHVGQSVRVTCPKGQQVKGSGTITCRPDLTWSPVSSVCESRCFILYSVYIMSTTASLLQVLVGNNNQIIISYLKKKVVYVFNSGANIQNISSSQSYRFNNKIWPITVSAGY